jgi:kinesin family protein 22
LNETLRGRNLTLFAYGQTGSGAKILIGKTHTMNGIPGERGIIPRVIETLLAEKTTVTASFIEIYNEKIFDLLNKQAPLDLRETSDKEIIIAGISSVEIPTISEFQNYQNTALSKRQTASTNLNTESSRSHYILQINITKKEGLKLYCSKIHLIDLAGSEDNKRTGNHGKRMNESCHINKSLFALGQVVEALNKSQTRIPYRESKITRFLQDSLGGKSIGVLIACCSSEQEDFIDTFNTLNFTTKCSLVKNVVQTNEVLTILIRFWLKIWKPRQIKENWPWMNGRRKKTGLVRNQMPNQNHWRLKKLKRNRL